MKRRHRLGLSLLIAAASLLAAWVVPVHGQGLVTDRPDFTESGVTVPLGSLQLEGGTTFSALGDDHSELVAGEALLRWGVHDVVEVRFGAPSLVSVSNGESTSGLSDGSIGAKLQLGPLSSGWDMALIGSLSVPVGDEEFSSDEFDPSFILTAGRTLSEKFTVAGQVMAAWPTQGNDREFEWGGTLVLGASVGPQTGAFLEVAATVPDQGTAPVVGHAGLTHALSDELQLDVHGGLGLSDTAPDAFVGAGVSVRVL